MYPELAVKEEVSITEFWILINPTWIIYTVCKLHIALHTCLQGKYNIGSIFVDKTGYNQVADANDIIVIYPQAKATSGSNANGCWDW